MAIVSKFLASKWVTVALILALAGGAYYVYSQGKMLGGAKEKLEAYEVTIAQQEAANKRLIADAQKKQDAIQRQSDKTQILSQQAGLLRQKLKEASDAAHKALKECLSMRLADGMLFGPSRDNAVSGNETRSDMGRSPKDTDS